MVLGMQPGIWVPPAPPAWPRSAPTSDQAFHPTGIKTNISLEKGKGKGKAKAKSSTMATTAPANPAASFTAYSGQAPPRMTARPAKAPQARPTASQPLQQQEALLPLPLRRLQQQQQEQLDELARQYGLAQKRVRDSDDATRTKMQDECAAAKGRARQEVQLACRGLTPENVEGQLRVRMKDIDLRRQQHEGDLQAQLSAQLAQLHAQLQEQEKAMRARHLAEKVQLEEEQEACEVRDEAEEVWQWIMDCFDGHADKSPLFRCFPVFDAARHDRRKLYDFVRMAQLELGWTMDWKMPDVVA